MLQGLQRPPLLGGTTLSVTPHPLQPPPPPRWGGPSLGPKSIGNTRPRRRRRTFFFRLRWNWGWGGPSLGDRPPPPPHGGERPDIGGGGGDYKGGRGVAVSPSLTSLFVLSDQQLTRVCHSANNALCCASQIVCVCVVVLSSGSLGEGSVVGARLALTMPGNSCLHSSGAAPKGLPAGALEVLTPLLLHPERRLVPRFVTMMNRST